VCLLQLLLYKPSLLVQPLTLQSHDHFADGEIGGQRLNVFLDLVDGLDARLDFFAVEKWMDEKVRLKSHNAKGPDIDRLGKLILLIKEYLRGPVDNSAGNLIGRLLHDGGAKISNLINALGKNNILRLDITMNDIFLMNEHQPLRHINEHMNVLILDQVLHVNAVA
jgi:hypothetical protein